MFLRRLGVRQNKLRQLRVILCGHFFSWRRVIHVKLSSYTCGGRRVAKPESGRVGAISVWGLELHSFRAFSGCVPPRGPAPTAL